MADATLAHVPADVSDEEALLLGDIFSTGFFAADNAGIAALAASACSAGSGAAGGAAGDGQQQGGEADGGEAGPVVAVVGCGPVGVLACIGGCLGPALTRSLDGLLRAFPRAFGIPGQAPPLLLPTHLPFCCQPFAGARELGAARVFAVDSVPERLALAARFGAEPLNREQCDPLEAIRWAMSMCFLLL